MGDVKGEGRSVASRIRATVFRIEFARRIVQLICFLLFNAGIFGVSPLPIVLPVLQSLGSIHNTVGEAIGLMEWMLYRLEFPWIPLASVLIFAAVSGRLVCGWICPFGFVQDLLRYAGVGKVRVSPKTHRYMTSMKYLALFLFIVVCGGLAVSSAIGVGQVYRETLGVVGEGPFTALSPSDTLFALTPRLIIVLQYSVFPISEAYEIPIGLLSSPLLWARLTIMVGVLVLALYVPRGWCRYFCPQGAMLALVSRFSFLGLRRELVRCTRASCRACVEACPMNIRILDQPWEKFTDPECIYCLRCVDACPSKAIRPTFP